MARALAQTSIDANADAAVDPRVLDAYFEASVFADTRAGHAAGAEARNAVASARERISAILCCEPHELVFVSGGTEADALALRLLGARAHLVVSSIEHAAIARGAGGAVRVPVGRTGRVRVEDVVARLKQSGAISILAASNETGVLQPVSAIADEAHQRGYLVHTDAVQLPGRASFTVPSLGADLVSFSAHKVGAPAGVGLLVNRLGEDSRHGVAWPDAAENVPGIVALARAFELLPSVAEMSATAAMRDAFEAACRARIERFEVIGAGEPRLSNTSCVLVEGCPGEALLMALDVQGFAVSTGSACSSGSIDASPILLGMGLSPAEARSSVRFSFGAPVDVDALADRLAAIVREVRAS